MDEQTTAAEALQQALKTEFNGDAGASEQDGRSQGSVTFAPKEAKVEAKSTAATNEEAKKERISQKEWQDMQEAIKKGQQTQAMLDKLKGALSDAPSEVQKEEDIAAQVGALKELVERKDWEGDHPIVKSEKYRDSWKKVNEDPDTRHLTYDMKWKLIKDEPESHSREDWKAQQLDVPHPTASRGGTVSKATASAMAADLLKQAGWKDEEMQKHGLRL